jgi:hypothetical protein
MSSLEVTSVVATENVVTVVTTESNTIAVTVTEPTTIVVADNTLRGARGVDGPQGPQGPSGPSGPPGEGGGVVGGSNTQILFNDGGTANGNASLTFDKSTGIVTFSGNSSLIPSGPNIDLTAGANGWAELQSNNFTSYMWVDDNGAYVGTDWDGAVSGSSKTWMFANNGWLMLPQVAGITQQAVINSEGDIVIAPNTANNFRFFANGTFYVPGDIIPNANVTWNLGAPDARFKDLWLSNTTIYLGNASISGTNDQISIPEMQTVNIAWQLPGGNTVVGPVTGNGLEVFTDVANAYVQMNWANTNYTWIDSTGVNIETNNSLVWMFANNGHTFLPNTGTNRLHLGDNSFIEYNGPHFFGQSGNAASNTIYTVTEQAENYWQTYQEVDVSGGNSAWSWIYSELFDANNPFVIIATKKLDEPELRWTFNANGTLVTPGGMNANGDLLPITNNAYSLGNTELQWKGLYVSNNTIYMDGVPFRIFSNGTATVNGTVLGSGGGGGGTGPQGPQGPQGPAGSNGSTGPQGPQGVAGSTGPQGPQGPSGASVTGPQGPQGPAGTNGSTGPQGPTGPVAGSDTQVIFNDSNVANGNVGLTFTKATANLAITGNVRVDGGILNSNAATITMFNATPTTINAFGNATTINFGKATTTTTLSGNIVANVAGFPVGYRDIPQVSFTGNTTLALTDAGKHYYSTLSTANTLTVPNNATVSFPVGATINFVNQGTANVVIAQGSGVTMYLAGGSTTGNRNLISYGVATIQKVATDTWFLVGVGLS